MDLEQVFPVPMGWTQCQDSLEPERIGLHSQGFHPGSGNLQITTLVHFSGHGGPCRLLMDLEQVFPVPMGWTQCQDSLEPERIGLHSQGFHPGS
jgi:hypothetical protein